MAQWYSDITWTETRIVFKLETPYVDVKGDFLEQKQGLYLNKANTTLLLKLHSLEQKQGLYLNDTKAFALIRNTPLEQKQGLYLNFNHPCEITASGTTWTETRIVFKSNSGLWKNTNP